MEENYCNVTQNISCNEECLMEKSAACLENEFESDCASWDFGFGIWSIFNSVLGTIGNIFVIMTFSSSKREKL